MPTINEGKNQHIMNASKLKKKCRRQVVKRRIINKTIAFFVPFSLCGFSLLPPRIRMHK